MARRIVKVSGRYRGERFETTLTQRRQVGSVSTAQFRVRITFAAKQFNEAMRTLGRQVTALSEGLGVKRIQQDYDKARLAFIAHGGDPRYITRVERAYRIEVEGPEPDGS